MLALLRQSYAISFSCKSFFGESIDDQGSIILSAVTRDTIKQAKDDAAIYMK
jgi:hypothetical protein